MTKKILASYSPEVRERAVRLMLEGGGDHPTQWGRYQFGVGQDRLHGGDAAQLGAPGGA